MKYVIDKEEEVAKDYMGKSYYSSGGRTGMARRISWEEPCLTLVVLHKSKRKDATQKKLDHLQ